MKKEMSLLIVAFIGFIFIASAGASTLTVDIDGLELLPVDPATGETDAIWSYQLNFSIDGDWSALETDSVVFNTTSNHTNWGTYENINENGELIILADVTNANQSPLLNGELFTITFPDEVTLSLEYDSFLLYSDFTTAVNLSFNPDPAVFGLGDNTLTLSADSSAVPIPSAILLFGGGLLGMLGIRRKTKQ